MGKVMAVCISEARGTQKQNIEKAKFIENYGIENDAHAGNWHRQISLLSYDKIEEFRAKGAEVGDGAFGENLVVQGFDFRLLPVGTRLRCGEVLLEITQIGKECHSHCQIYHKMGECIMPKEGVFARVLHGGEICVGDEMEICYRVAVLTASDKGAHGEREDLSGQLVCDMVEEIGWSVTERKICPDDRWILADKMRKICDNQIADLILTTGGTGFSPRDVTPEATMDIAERVVPGIAEAIRAYSMQITRRAMLSRATAGIRKRTLIVNLPGSPKAVKESLEFLLPELPHGLGVLTGTQTECARKDMAHSGLNYKKRQECSNMEKTIIQTNNAPAAIGPYSQAVKANGFLYISGQLPIDPATGVFAGEEIAAQTHQSLENIKNILKEAGADMANVVKTTVLLKNMADFAEMNRVYAEFFTSDYPARAAFEVAALPKNALVEIEAVAVL